MKPEQIMQLVENVMLSRWQWGQYDCCTSACDIFNELHRIDPMQPLRGKYDSALSAGRIVTQLGGFLNMAEGLADQAGLRIGTGLPGEIGLSFEGAAVGFENRALLICVENGAWAGKTESGFAIVSGAERCWRV